MINFTLESLQAGAVLLIDKPFKWTSFDVVNYIRKSINVKVGHAGTLDPLATGLLILCTGTFTKKIESYQGLNKTYTGVIVIGASTPSYDLETEVNNEMEVGNITNEQIMDIAASFIGKQLQNAPLYSAKKIEGERAYLKARRGEDVVIKANEIEITDFKIAHIIRELNQIQVHFEITCTKGTYIRAIARDFGLKLNNVAHLTHLKRTAIADFLLTNAITIEQFRTAFPPLEKQKKPIKDSPKVL